MPFAAYYNMDMSALDVEAGFPVSKNLPGKDNIKAGKIDGGSPGMLVVMMRLDLRMMR